MRPRFLYLLPVFILLLAHSALGHDAAEHVDPELLTGWRTWLHLTIQWTHLMAFALWLGVIVGTLVLKLKPRLDVLLYNSWILFLLIFATGSYNMEWSAGISDTPSVFLLPLLTRVPYGVSYTVALAAKLGIYLLILLLTLAITILHLKHQIDEAKLQKTFLLAASFLGVTITLMTAVVLYYHEAADLWPTPVHSLDGVMTARGPHVKSSVKPDSPPPNDFSLLATRDAWIDVVLRWIHLLGFGLLSGGIVTAAFFKEASMKRFLWYAWILLIIQLVSGIGNMARWTPFDPAPYIWNLTALSHIRFGRTYSLFMAAKHTLIFGLVGLIALQTYQYFKVSHNTENSISFRPYFILEAFLALAIAYIMIIVLLLHEGVDHAL